MSEPRSQVSCNVMPLSIGIGGITYLLTGSIGWAIVVGAFWWFPVIALLMALALVLSATQAAGKAYGRDKARRRQKARMEKRNRS